MTRDEALYEIGMYRSQQHLWPLRLRYWEEEASLRIVAVERGYVSGRKIESAIRLIGAYQTLLDRPFHDA